MGIGMARIAFRCGLHRDGSYVVVSTIMSASSGAEDEAESSCPRSEVRGFQVPCLCGGDWGSWLVGGLLGLAFGVAMTQIFMARWMRGLDPRYMGEGSPSWVICSLFLIEVDLVPSYPSQE